MPARPDKAGKKPAVDGESPAICLLGSHETDYPRNRSVRKALEAAGFRILLAHSGAPFPWRHFILAWRCLRLRGQSRWIWVTEGGHRLVPWVKLLAKLTGRKVAFDPFLSRYNTRVEDRRLYRPGGLQARIAHWQDWSSTRSADLLVFDTEEHKHYFYRRYGLSQPHLILPVGVPEEVFHPLPQTGAGAPLDPFPPLPPQSPRPGFRVLFYGSYIPLQGVEWIVAAAAFMRETDVRFTLIGGGQTFAEIEARARALALPNLALLPAVPEAALPAWIAHSQVCLGIFGDTLKAANVVPNKVVQAAALGRPMITRDSPAIRRYFRDGENAVLVPAASPQTLAEAILALRDDAARRERLGRGARRVFEASFSVTALSRLLKATLATESVSGE